MDLLGNHLPCPSLSFEENPSQEFSEVINEINLLKTDVKGSYKSPIFKEFERYRSKRVFKNNMFPCKFCKFQDQCVPCTAQLVGGGQNEDIVDICKALYNYGDEYLPNFKNEIWVS